MMNMSEEERARVYALMSPEIAMRAQYDCGRFIEEKEKIKKKARKGWKMIKERTLILTLTLIGGTQRVEDD